MKIKINLFISILFAINFISIGQNLPIIQPTVSHSNLFTKTDQINWQKTDSLFSLINSGDVDYDLISEKEKIMIDSLEMGYGPMSVPSGCSWYCAGGPYKTTCSSHLKEKGNIDYLPENIHDFDLFTAWIPDINDGPIGQKINFYFEPFAPRINEIIIWNGYIKNVDLWYANSRVAKLKLSVNGVPVAILELKDVNNTQSFKIDPVQSRDSSKDLILTLEILEVYKGTKYNDVVISEINFDGLDVH